MLGDAAVKDCDDNKDRGKLGNRAQSLAKREEGFGAVSCLVIGLRLAPLWMTKSALPCPRFVFVLPKVLSLLPFSSCHVIPVFANMSSLPEIIIQSVFLIVAISVMPSQKNSDYADREMIR